LFKGSGSGMIETLIGVAIGMVALMLIQGTLDRVFIIKWFKAKEKAKPK